jgi:bifunctional DNA-binding transcriptional regulator/antitoxin component of YhaV-PrlF toxin-antitoxin module
MDTTVKLQELEDGELWFEIPDPIWEQLGWGEGTVLDWTVIGDSIRISKVDPGLSGVAGNVSVVERGDLQVEEGDGVVVDESST